MDGPPAQSLGVEPVHGAIVRRAPRRAGDPVISTRLMFRVLTSGALIVVGTLWVFCREMTEVRDFPSRSICDEGPPIIAVHRKHASTRRRYGNSFRRKCVGFDVLVVTTGRSPVQWPQTSWRGLLRRGKANTDVTFYLSSSPHSCSSVRAAVASSPFRTV